MNRRDFLKTTSLGSGALAASPLAVQPPNKGQNYYEFSPDGRECIVKRHDTPIPWMNLLSNDTFQTWITHTGHIESFMLDRGLGGLTNPQEVSGFIYLRDRRTGRYFMLNKKPADGSWRAAHGMGYTTMTASALGLTAAVTYFVPRDDSVLVWIVNVQNSEAATHEVDVFSTVEWSLGDQNKQIVFRGHGGGGDGFTGGSQFNLYKKVYLEDGILYAIQNVWRTLGIGAKPWRNTLLKRVSLINSVPA